MMHETRWGGEKEKAPRWTQKRKKGLGERQYNQYFRLREMHN